MSKVNKILKRCYITVKIELASPLALSNGFDENTDSDVLRNGLGEIFVPGTSIAGAFRNYLDKKKNEPGIFGYSKPMENTKDSGRMSSIFISDLYLKNTNIAERDGIKLNDDKIVDDTGKFDYEIVETGATGSLKIEQVVREQDVPEEKDTPSDIDSIVKNEISILLSALDSGEIRLGSKKNRGCGWISVKEVYYDSFTDTQRNEWIEYCKNLQKRDSNNQWNDWKIELNDKSKYISISIPLKLVGGISIRRYSAQPQQSDYEHITIKKTGKENSEKIPVIPGSSWNGAIRNCAKRIMKELKMPEIDTKLNVWFGMNATDAAKKADMRQSMVVFKESIIKGAVELPITRNKVNRFDASTVNSALYSETSYFGGTTILEILVQKKENEYENDLIVKPLIGLLTLIIKELEEGYLAVGGQTSVGRGIFESNGEVCFSDKFNSKKLQTECLQALASLALPNR